MMRHTHTQTGEHISHAKTLFIEQHEPLLITGALKGKKVVQISSGQLHTTALDDEGYCYSWGWGGGSFFLSPRLGERS